MNWTPIRRFAIVAVLVAGIIWVGFVWRGEQPATPAEITKAVAGLNKAQRERFVNRTGIGSISELYPEGRVLSYYDLNEAVDYAKDTGVDAKTIQAQDEALKRALQP